MLGLYARPCTPPRFVLGEKNKYCVPELPVSQISLQHVSLGLLYQPVLQKPDVIRMHQ